MSLRVYCVRLKNTARASIVIDAGQNLNLCLCQIAVHEMGEFDMSGTSNHKLAQDPHKGDRLQEIEILMTRGEVA